MYERYKFRNIKVFRVGLSILICTSMLFTISKTVKADTSEWSIYSNSANSTINSAEYNKMNSFNSSYTTVPTQADINGTNVTDSNGVTPPSGTPGYYGISNYHGWDAFDTTVIPGSYVYDNIAVDSNHKVQSEWFLSPWGPLLDYLQNNDASNPTAQEADSITFANNNNCFNSTYAYVGSGASDGYLGDIKSAAMIHYQDSTPAYPLLVNSSTDGVSTAITNALDSHKVKNMILLGGDQRYSTLAGIDQNLNVVRIGGSERNQTFYYLQLVEQYSKDTIYNLSAPPALNSSGYYMDLLGDSSADSTTIQGFLSQHDIKDAAAALLSGAKFGSDSNIKSGTPAAVIACNDANDSSKVSVLRVYEMDNTNGYEYGVYSFVGDNYFTTSTPPPPTQTQTVTIKYINQDTGNQVISDDVYNNVPVGTQTYTAKTFADYDLVGSNTVTIDVQAGQNYTETFYYKSNLTIGDNYVVQCEDDRTHEVIQTLNGIINIFQTLTVNAPDISGYTIDPPTGAVFYGSEPDGQVFKYIFYYHKIPMPPSIYLIAPTVPIHQGQSYQVSANGIDPQNESLTYYWTTNDGQVISGTGATLIAGSTNETVTVYAIDTEGLKSNTCTAVIDCYNNPPIIQLNVPTTANIGDDIPITATIFDPDEDTVSTVWNNPASMLGGPINNDNNVITSTVNTSVYFNNASDVNKTYNFTVIATDQFGLSSTATASITILPVTPTALLTLGGYKKENRLETLTASETAGTSTRAAIASRSFQFFDSNNNLLTVDNVPTSSNIVKSLEPLTNSSLDFLIKTQGSYTAKYTVTNSYGISATATQTITVTQDLEPTASFTISKGDASNPGSPYADKNNTDGQGHALFTRTLTDNSFSKDSDTISHRYWFICWDANNNRKADDAFMIYSDGKWQPLSNFTTDGKGTFDEIQHLDLTKIDDGNCTSVTFQSPWVGNYYYYEITQESFGQPTIPQLTTNADYRISDRTDIATMPVMPGN